MDNGVRFVHKNKNTANIYVPHSDQCQRLGL
jgi:hypothetical protein